MNETNRVVRTLWIGESLSTMERLSLRSFLAHGHEVHLYTYGEVAGVPAGTIVEDANRIVPAEKIFRFRGDGSYAAFSDLFRWALLGGEGGWWVDTDVVCLAPFDFETPWVFASECDALYASESVTSGVVKAPGGSEAMRWALELCGRKDLERLDWGEIGPHLVGDLVNHYALGRYVEPYTTFCPTFCAHAGRFVDPERSWSGLLTRDRESYAVHLWNEMWGKLNLDKDARYPAECLYERLKAWYL